jgi:hypothetical protein
MPARMADQEEGAIWFARKRFLVLFFASFPGKVRHGEQVVLPQEQFT